MSRYYFERDCRTPHSESLLILDGERQIGRVDLHFAPTVVHATLIVNESVTQEEIEDLIQIIDEELVMPAETPRDDFIIAVYQGRELGVYSDQDFEEEEEEGEEQERRSEW
ncbi:MAG: hypothetical protein HYX97_04475 [Chloroflexi bacterium]|nr:hypothetical protein [Chloroflexota bacterium]